MRVFIMLALIYNLHIYQMDIKTTFLNGDINGSLYEQSKNFVLSRNEKKVCNLVKSLYNLKKVPK